VDGRGVACGPSRLDALRVSGGPAEIDPASLGVDRRVASAGSRYVPPSRVASAAAHPAEPDARTSCRVASTCPWQACSSSWRLALEIRGGETCAFPVRCL
jgi:hypothetical protein